MNILSSEICNFNYSGFQQAKNHMGFKAPCELSHENQFFQLQLSTFIYRLHSNSASTFSLFPPPPPLPILPLSHTISSCHGRNHTFCFRQCSLFQLSIAQTLPEMHRREAAWHWEAAPPWQYLHSEPSKVCGSFTMI